MWYCLKGGKVRCDLIELLTKGLPGWAHDVSAIVVARYC